MIQYKLRDYQETSVKAGVKYFKNPKEKSGAVIVLPTGSGKSLVIAGIVKELSEPTLVFQPSKEILEQNFQKLLSYGVTDAGVYSASFNSKQIKKITFATIGSVRTKPELFKSFKNIIIDECHLVNPKQGMYKSFLEEVGERALGLTATPYRLNTDGYGGSMLKFITRTRPNVFKKIIAHTQVSELMNQGYLSPLKYFQVDGFDSSKLKLNSAGAEYTDESIHKYYTEINFFRRIVEVVNKLIHRKNVLVFTSFIDEAGALVKTLGGDIAAIVTGKTKKKDRERILNDYKSGKIKVIANVGVLTTGFDFPELETIVLARPTRSLALYYQIIGRAIRPHDFKSEAWIIDMCENYKRFGRVEDLKMVEPKPNLWHIENNDRQLTNIYYN